METWRHGHGDMDMETWTWRHRHGDMDMKTWTWSHRHGDMDMETWTRRRGIKIINRKWKPRQFSSISLLFTHRATGSLSFVRLFTKKQREVIRLQMDFPIYETY
jgi:hypothetical protein